MISMADWYDLTCNRGIDWGDFPAWAAAVGTWAAALGAALAALALWHLERNRDWAEEQRRKRAQAEQVSVYWDKKPGFAARLIVHNLSDQPITDTAVYARLNGEEVPMASSPEIVPPQGSEEVEVLDRGYVWACVDGAAEITDRQWFGPMFGLRFTDVEGRRWHRPPGSRVIPEHAPRATDDQAGRRLRALQR